MLHHFPLETASKDFVKYSSAMLAMDGDGKGTSSCAAAVPEARLAATSHAPFVNYNNHVDDFNENLPAALWGRRLNSNSIFSAIHCCTSSAGSYDFDRGDS